MSELKNKNLTEVEMLKSMCTRLFVRLAQQDTSVLMCSEAISLQLGSGGMHSDTVNAIIKSNIELLDDVDPELTAVNDAAIFASVISDWDIDPVDFVVSDDFEEQARTNLLAQLKSEIAGESPELAEMIDSLAAEFTESGGEGETLH